MRFSIATTLLSVTSLTQAAPAAHGHGHAHQIRDVQPPSFQVNGGKYQSGIFYTNWALYGRQHFVTDLQADKLTKINYAFANVNNVTGEVYLTDEYSDLQFRYPGDVASNGTQLLGNFNQLYKLKQTNRNLKVSLSIGGWTYSPNFKPALSTPAGRYKFCTSSMTLMADLGLDGIDIDWEFPEDETDAVNYLATVELCRKTFDDYARENANGYHFDLSISSPAGEDNYNVMPIKLMDAYVDNWNLMAFDYHGGGFSNLTGHQSNVFPSRKNPRSTDMWNSKKKAWSPQDTHTVIKHYKANVASLSKVQLGLPLYGRSFANVVDLGYGTNGMGQPFNGTGEGTWEPGALDYKVLPQNGSTVYTDRESMSSWSWDAKKKQVVSFDTPEVSSWKAQYLMKEGLGGAWWWDSSGDKKADSGESLVSTVVETLGGPQSLKQDQNNLYYPLSKYYNIRGASSSNSSAVW